MPRRRAAAFTLIELLTVIAILGILAAITIPTITGGRDAALRAKTRAQFNQWATALELYRQEYGRYPVIAVNGKVDGVRLLAELSGRPTNGESSATELGNRKGIVFYQFSADELDADGRLIDAFGNTDIGVRFDANRDGLIDSSDGGSWAAVTAGGEDAEFSPADHADAATNRGVRATVVFYSAGRGRDVTDMVLSWR